MNLNYQPIINIGTLGSVSDGKSTLIYQLTGIKTQKHSSEKNRNITIKAGYANLKIWKCNICSELYSTDSDKYNYICNNCLDLDSEIESNCSLVNHISFVDCPGHQELILTMLGSVSLMKGVIVVVSAAEPIKKKPQLIQHLKALKLANINKIIICFNKLDLISKEIAIERKKELDDLLLELNITPNIIIPTSFNKKIGLSSILRYIMELYNPSNIINENINNKTLFRITRTFDINKPGISWENVKGGVLGGGLIDGSLKIGDEIEIRPGIILKDKTHKPIITKILSLKTDKINLTSITPGGLIGIETTIDPYYCKNDMLIGNIIGHVGELPKVYKEIKLNYTKLEDFDGLWEPKNNDIVYLQIGNISTEAKLIDSTSMYLSLLNPVCIETNIIILVCKKELNTLIIVGYGYIID